MIAILLKYIIISIILYVPYKLWFEKINIPYFKRFYLIAILVIPICIPFITLTVNHENIITNHVSILENTYTEAIDYKFYDNNTAENTTPELVPEQTAIWTIYIVITSLLIFRLAYNLFKIKRLINKNKRINKSPFVLVLIPHITTPFTFMRYIFLNTNDYKNSIPESILLHEKAHALQLHSVDIVLFEILQSFLWFNPILPFIKKAIQLNHEFLADRFVVDHSRDIKSYGYLLLNLTHQPKTITLSSELNYKHIKKRLIMMTKSKRKNTVFITVSAITIAFATAAFANKQNMEEKILEIPQQVSPRKETTLQSVSDGAPKHLLAEYDSVITAITTYETDKNGNRITSRSLKNVNLNRMAFIASLMNEKQIKERTSSSHGIDSPKSWLTLSTKPKQKTPSRAEFDNWQNAKIYGVWIDGKKSINTDLLKFNHSDIKLYYISKLHGKAKVGRNYTHQLDVYTQKGYDKAFASRK